MNIPDDIKKKMKEQRLKQYQQQMFALQMDIAALEAIGDTERVKEAYKALEDVKKAYKAVEAL